MGNFGPSGMQVFLMTHHCNPLCEQLALPLVRRKTGSLDIGTKKGVRRCRRCFVLALGSEQTSAMQVSRRFRESRAICPSYCDLYGFSIGSRSVRKGVLVLQGNRGRRLSRE